MSDCEIGISLACLEACDAQDIQIIVQLTLCEFHTKNMIHKNILVKLKQEKSNDLTIKQEHE